MRVVLLHEMNSFAYIDRFCVTKIILYSIYIILPQNSPRRCVKEYFWADMISILLLVAALIIQQCGPHDRLSLEGT